MQQRYGTRRGFARADLLVLVVVALVLLALLAPLLARAQQTADAMRCANNLSEIALAFHNLHNDYNIFATGGGHAAQGRAYRLGNKFERHPPLGGVLAPGADAVPPPYQEWGWAYQILPYIEHLQVWKSPKDDDIRQTPISVYFCRLRRKPSLNEKNAKGLQMAGIDYGGNGGITGPVKAVQRLTPRSYSPPYGDYTATGLVIRSSSWYPEKGPRLRSVSLDGGVPDGTSNTILLAHKRMQLDKVNKNPANDDWSFVDGWGEDTIVRYHPEDAKLQPQQDNRDPVPEFAMGSAHPQAMPVVFTDRSVRRIRYTAKPETLAAAMIRDDGVGFDLKDLE
ncbi:hypothetical protein HRbin36_00581 [bacterium HR36]|nr:hypothetical protein HRbin36_00581 [bacterium HR36]